MTKSHVPSPRRPVISRFAPFVDSPRAAVSDNGKILISLKIKRTGIIKMDVEIKAEILRGPLLSIPQVQRLGMRGNRGRRFQAILIQPCLPAEAQAYASAGRIFWHLLFMLNFESFGINESFAFDQAKSVISQIIAGIIICLSKFNVQEKSTLCFNEKN